MENMVLYFFEDIQGRVKTFYTDPTITENFFVMLVDIAENEKEKYIKSEIAKKAKELNIGNATLAIQITNMAGHYYIRCPVENSKINFRKYTKECHGINGGKTI
jgi:hypothetical protein